MEERHHAVTDWPQITPGGARSEALKVVCVWLAMPAATLMMMSRGDDLTAHTAPLCFASAALAAAAYALVLRAERAGRVALGLNSRGGHDPSLASFQRRCIASLPPVVITLLLVGPAARIPAMFVLLQAVLLLFAVRRSQKLCAAARSARAQTRPPAAAPETFRLGALLEFGEGAVCWTSDDAFLRTAGGTLVLDATAAATYSATPAHRVRLVRYASGFIASIFPAGDVPTLRDADLPESVIVIENQ